MVKERRGKELPEGKPKGRGKHSSGTRSQRNNLEREQQTQETLRQSEEKLRVIIESIPQGVAVSDMNAKLLQVNNAVLQLHGYGRQELIGRSAFTLIAEEDHARAMDNLKKTLETGRSGTLEYTFIRRDGSTFPAQLSAALIKDGSGKPIGFVAVTEDISDRKKMEGQLILTDRLASIGQLAAGMAHELNNPLTGVIGFSEVLLEKNLPEDIKEDLVTINREARRAANVVRGLLTFTREQVTEKVLVDINSIIQWVLQLRSYEHRAKNIEVDTRFASDLPKVMGNAVQMQQVFINIVINAEQAMVGAHGRGKLTIATERVGDTVRASITDDGPGISPDNMKKLFTPFFTTREVGKGTGLGLSICHGIVTEHGGKLYADSKIGKGATFVVELPISKYSREGGAQ
jgi:two-component system NtrC family sensor kinase